MAAHIIGWQHRSILHNRRKVNLPFNLGICLIPVVSEFGWRYIQTKSLMLPFSNTRKCILFREHYERQREMGAVTLLPCAYLPRYGANAAANFLPSSLNAKCLTSIGPCKTIKYNSHLWLNDG